MISWANDTERAENEQERNDRLYGFGRHAADRWGIGGMTAPPLSVATDTRLFPVHPIHRAYMGGIAWNIVEPHAEQAYANHGQSLETLAGRGGLDLSELAAVLEDRRYRTMERMEALRRIKAFLP